MVELEAGGSHTFKERSEDMGSWQVIIVINAIIIMINTITIIIMAGGQIIYNRSLKGARRELFFPDIKQSFPEAGGQSTCIITCIIIV